MTISIPLFLERPLLPLLMGLLPILVCPIIACQPSSQSPEMAIDTPQQLSQEAPTFSFIETNGIRMRVAEQGEGPLVLFLHGFPELWYSWRHQLAAVAQAGYRGVAPDMRGYGETDAPPNIEDYSVLEVCRDVEGILDALGEETAILVSHDWGAAIAWNCVLLSPDRYTGHVAMSVPYGGRGSTSYLQQLRKIYGDNFFYMLYFQEPGVAEAELDPNPTGLLKRFFTSPDTPREAPSITSPKASAGGLLGRIGMPTALPSWLTQEDLDYYVNTFTQTGFRGGLNYYRNFDLNWEQSAPLQGKQIDIPTLFLAGEQDLVIRGQSKEQLEAIMRPFAPNLRDVVLFPNTGHWVQQERADSVNTYLLEFLRSLEN